MRPFKPVPKRSNSPIDEELFLRAARAYALKRFPNPDRKGCPTAAEIGAMARREASLNSIGTHAEHIATCSACLSDYLAAREKWKRRRRRTIAILATAAGLAASIIGVISLRSPTPTPPTPPPIAQERRAQPELQLATLDLRPLDANRGEPSTQIEIPVLAKANLRLTILLPTGSDEGNYQFEIRDERGSPQVKGAGRAVIRNYVTTIETAFDLRQLSPGRFTWSIRRAEESRWRSYPLKVR
jgi:hypothetical protein